MLKNFQGIRIPKPKLIFGGGLSGTLFRNLLVLTFIPLIFMAGAAYIRTRYLLREQILAQTKYAAVSSIAELNTEIQAKEARLDQLMQTPDFNSLIGLAFKVNSTSPEFSYIRANALEIYNRNNKEGSQAFNEFFIVDNTGKIILSSNSGWEGWVLNNPDLSGLISSGNPTGIIMNLEPLYPTDLFLATIQRFDLDTQYGPVAGTIVGVSNSTDLLGMLTSLIGSNSSSKAFFILRSGDFITQDLASNTLIDLNDSDQRKPALLPLVDSLVAENNLDPTSKSYELQNGNQVLAQVSWVPALNAAIALEYDQKELFGSLNSLVPFTILLVLSALGAMGLVIVIGTNRIVRPLHNITTITEKFAKGDLNARAEGSDRKDEIGELARAFNQMADELSDLYRSLELKVDERTRQVRTAAEIAQSLTSLTSLDDLLSKTVELLVSQFEFYEAHIFMIDRAGKTASLRAARGPAAVRLLEIGHRLDVGSESIIGWVSAHNKPRVASDVSEDPIHFKNELLPETKAEASVPISVGNLVLGVLDVQSINAGAFSQETVVMLETLASQIAVAIQNVGLVETTQVNFQELSRLYRATRAIAESKTEQELLELSGRVLRDAPFPVVLVALRENDLEILTLADSTNIVGATIEFQRYLSADMGQIKKVFQAGPIITDSGDNRIPAAIFEIVRRLGFDSAAYLPIHRADELAAVIILGAKRQVLTNSLIQPYINLADLVSANLEKLSLVSGNAKRANELEALSAINQALTTTQDMPNFYATLHEHVRSLIGDYSFTVALYDERKNTISIPYNFDDNKLTAVEPFPLGEGMTSVLIHTRQPLLLVHDTERQAALLGAKVVGRPARSWMGAPMMAQDTVVGALIIQDLEREYMFNESDLKFFKSLADQVAGVINNSRLLDESNQRSLQLEIAADISRDISGSLNLDELLLKAVTLIRERFEFYHAAIFLVDSPVEFAVIREATGDAGQQMKRTGHKIAIGSKSIVGFVSGRGERLVVNDTSKDATYFANPLLPNTRAEAAMPMKVGERILGVLDVQSDHPYAFTDDNLRSIQLLSDQLAIAVVNTELFAETQEHLSQQRLLHHITATAASGTTLDEALEGAVKGLQVTLGGDRVAILLADRTEKLLEVMAVVGYSEDVANLKIPIGTGISGSAALQRRALRINDVTKDSRYIQVSPNTRSELAVPLIYRNELLGVINVESEKVEAYSDDDEEMLGTLGGSLAAIIANARLLEQIRDKAERDRTIYEITGKIRKSMDIQTILATTATELTKVVGARRTKIEVTPQELDPDGSTG